MSELRRATFRVPKGPEALASSKQLWALNQFDNGLAEAVRESPGERVTWDAAWDTIERAKADGRYVQRNWRDPAELAS